MSASGNALATYRPLNVVEHHCCFRRHLLFSVVRRLDRCRFTARLMSRRTARTVSLPRSIQVKRGCRRVGPVQILHAFVQRVRAVHLRESLRKERCRRRRKPPRCRLRGGGQQQQQQQRPLLGRTPAVRGARSHGDCPARPCGLFCTNQRSCRSVRIRSLRAFERFEVYTMYRVRYAL